MRVLVKGKVTRDVSWTILLVLILGSGLTVWILVPSITDSLQSGLDSYANQVSTFIVIQNNAGPHPGGSSKQLQEILPQIETIPGVEAAYPIDYNYTNELSQFDLCLPGSACRNITGVQGFASAPIGGKDGYPSALISLTKGHMPQGNEPAFIENNPELFIFHNGTYRLMIGSNEWNSTQGVRFNATIGGVSALNPITGEIQMLWNSTFLQNKLGPQLYNSSFGGPPNFMVIKADNIGDVQRVANSVSKLLGTHSNFFVAYDQSTLLELQSLETQSAPLYWLLTGVSLAMASTVVFLVSYLGGVRRKWEPGLLLTQGWTWVKYSEFVLFYFFIIALAASACGAMAALGVGYFLSYQYQVFGNILTIRIEINPFYLISVIPLSLFISAVAAVVSTTKVRHMGLDNILRDY